MHTSALPSPQPAANHEAAPEADLFVQESPQALMLEFTGTLKADAQVRMKPVGDGGHALPVLCLELQDVGPGRHCLRADHLYPEAERAQAERLASTLRRGMRVRVATSALDLRLYLPHVERIAIDAAAQPHH